MFRIVTFLSWPWCDLIHTSSPLCDSVFPSVKGMITHKDAEGITPDNPCIKLNYKIQNSRN